MSLNIRISYGDQENIFRLYRDILRQPIGNDMLDGVGVDIVTYLSSDNKSLHDRFLKQLIHLENQANLLANGLLFCGDAARATRMFDLSHYFCRIRYNHSKGDYLLVGTPWSDKVGTLPSDKEKLSSTVTV